MADLHGRAGPQHGWVRARVEAPAVLEQLAEPLRFEPQVVHDDDVFSTTMQPQYGLLKIRRFVLPRAGRADLADAGGRLAEE